MRNSRSWCRYNEGFSLHANLEIPKKKRKLLEKICRYITRPAISNERLSVDYAGNIIYHLKTAYSDGTTQLSFTPHEFVEKLMALVTPPRSNLVRYHGVYAPRFKHRNKVVKSKRKIDKEETSVKYRLPWAELLKRVFNIDSLKCSRCNHQMAFVRTICSGLVISKILKSLGIKRVKINIPKYRGPPSLFDEYNQDIMSPDTDFY